MIIIVSDVAVDLLMGALTGILRDVLTNIDVDVNANVFTGVVSAFGVFMPNPLEGFRCWAALDCRLMAAALDCASVLQAWMPSYHV